MEEPTEEEKKLAQSHELSLLWFQDLIQDGRARPVTTDPPEPNDLYRHACPLPFDPFEDALSESLINRANIQNSIMYTSGTTDDPKGVKLTHRNVMAMMASVDQRVERDVATSKDAYLSYLPLAHIFERAIMQCAFSRGTRIGFYQVPSSTSLSSLP